MMVGKNRSTNHLNQRPPIVSTTICCCRSAAHMKKTFLTTVSTVQQLQFISLAIIFCKLKLVAALFATTLLKHNNTFLTTVNNNIFPPANSARLTAVLDQRHLSLPQFLVQISCRPKYLVHCSNILLIKREEAKSSSFRYPADKKQM